MGSVVLLLVVVWGGFVVAGVWSAYRHDQRGMADLTAVRSHLDPATVTASTTEQSLRTASTEFASAHADLSGVVMAPATWLPVLGRQLTSARSLSSAAQQVATVGATFLAQVHDVLDQPHGAGPQRVESLRRLGMVRPGETIYRIGSPTVDSTRTPAATRR